LSGARTGQPVDGETKLYSLPGQWSCTEKCGSRNALGERALDDLAGAGGARGFNKITDEPEAGADGIHDARLGVFRCARRNDFDALDMGAHGVIEGLAR